MSKKPSIKDLYNKAYKNLLRRIRYFNKKGNSIDLENIPLKKEKPRRRDIDYINSLRGKKLENKLTYKPKQKKEKKPKKEKKIVKTEIPRFSASNELYDMLYYSYPEIKYFKRGVKSNVKNHRDFLLQLYNDLKNKLTPEELDNFINTNANKFNLALDRINRSSDIDEYNYYYQSLINLLSAQKADRLTNALIFDDLVGLIA